MVLTGVCAEALWLGFVVRVDGCLHNTNVFEGLEDLVLVHAVEGGNNFQVTARALKIPALVALLLERYAVALHASEQLFVAFEGETFWIGRLGRSLRNGHVLIIYTGRHHHHSLTGHGLEHPGLMVKVRLEHEIAPRPCHGVVLLV